MADASHSKKKPNKQHLAHGASFLRMASDYRARSKRYFAKWNKTRSDDDESQRVLIIAEVLEQNAQVCETEGRTVRHLR